MKRFVPFTAVPVLLFLLSMRGMAQNFTATYAFGSVTTTSGTTDPTPVPTATGVIFGSFSAVGASANPNAGGRFSFTNWPLGATNSSDVFTGTINTSQYYQVTITPQPNFSLSINSITFTMQRSGTGVRRYAVRAGNDSYATNLPASINPVNASLSVVGTDTFQVSDAATVANDGSTITLTSFNNLTSAVTLRFYGWNAEGSGGTFSIDNVVINGSANPLAGAPALTVVPDVINFPSTAVNTTGAAIPYTILGENLTGPVAITTAAPYSVSEDSISFSSALNIAAAAVTSAKKIFVKFSPTTTGAFAGSVLNVSNGANNKTVTLNGQAIDPANLSFNFNSCTNLGAPGSGFTTYSVTGAQMWTCTTFGYNNTNGVNMNGFSGSALENDDWLISPPLQISSLALPVFSFWSRAEFSGPSLQLLVSTNYTGSGNPNNAAWSTLNGNFPSVGGNVWTLSDNINLTAYKNNPQVFIAFRYVSSPVLGAPRWTLDSMQVTNRTSLFSVSPLTLNFGEVSAGAASAGQPVTLQAINYGDVTVTAPSGYQVSTNNTSFFTAVVIPQATAAAGTTVYVRFAPGSKSLKITGQLNFSATGYNQNQVSLTGSSFPKAETFDAACYNLSFFGSNDTNNPTQAKIDLQVANIAAILQRMNMDVVGFEEMSNDVALDSLIKKLPGKAAVVSNRWSYSFDPPSPTFPPQKVGFIYDTAVLKLVSSRAMFTGLYDSVRANQTTVLNDYPTGSGSSFWSSGRLPFMATFNATVQGVTKQIRMIVLHGKALGDLESFQRRQYDARVLRDSLERYYKDDNIIMVGDYNDRMVGSIYTASSISPYLPFLNNPNDSVLTYQLDAAGTSSFIGGTGMIDHIMITNELQGNYIPGSVDIEPANTYITNYNATTASDHLPVVSRFSFTDQSLPVKLVRFDAKAAGRQVLVSWTTATEEKNSHFVVERAGDDRRFAAIATVAGKGNTTNYNNYDVIDAAPIAGNNYYRLQQVDADGKTTTSQIVLVNFGSKGGYVVYPNPVGHYIQIKTDMTITQLNARVIGVDGRTMVQAAGNINQVNEQLNRRLNGLQPGVYMLQLNDGNASSTIKFVKH